MTSESLAYLAGLIDGEGCINLRRSHGRPRSTAQIQLSQTYAPTLITWIAETFGGKVSYHKGNPIRRQKPRYTWYITGKAACSLLQILEPYLRLKQDQARFVIDNHGSSDPELKNQLSEMKRTVK